MAGSLMTAITEWLQSVDRSANATTPSAGHGRWFWKNKAPYGINSDGTVFSLVGGSGITTVAQDISADFGSATDSAWHDITGLTGIVLAIGTWVGYVDLEIDCGATYGPVFRVWDGTDTYAQAGVLNGGIAGVSNHLSFGTKPLVLAAETTMAISVFTDTALTVKKYPNRGGLTSAIASHVTFIQVA